MKQRLIISETSSSTWNYHLRLVAEGEEKYSGGAGKALCGRDLGWDVQIPVETYGKKSDHIPMKFCEECRVIALLENVTGSERLNKSGVD